MQTIYLVRHGETEWNRNGRMQGQQDSPLTENGQDQVRRVGLLLGDLLPDPDACTLVVSPLGRTAQTAGIIADAMGIGADRFAVDPMVQEISWGQWEGRTHGEIEAADREGWQRFQADRWSHRPPGGESYADLDDRVRRWLASVADLQTVLLVSHGGFGRALRGRYQGLPQADTLALQAPQDAVIRLSQGVAAQLDAAPGDA